MPKLGNSELEQHKLTVNHFGFSAQRISDLGATEYTLCTLVVDNSGSVASFAREQEKCIKECLKSCKHSPRADYLMVRLVQFDSTVKEVHGFKLLSNINLDDYDNILTCGGTTALFDATENAVEATVAYSKSLVDNDLSVNAIVIVITDGDDNASNATKNSCKTAFEKAISSESLESLVSILVGVNVGDVALANYLDSFMKEAGITQYVELNNASEKTMARLAQFVSRSISSQSVSLGTGGPSKSLTF